LCLLCNEDPKDPLAKFIWNKNFIRSLGMDVCSSAVRWLTSDVHDLALLLGRRVVINGLVAKPELNGRTGTALSYYGEKGLLR
jgi:hypothetical protein